MPLDMVDKLKRDLNYSSNSAVKNSCTKMEFPFVWKGAIGPTI